MSSKGWSSERQQSTPGLPSEASSACRRKDVNVFVQPSLGIVGPTRMDYPGSMAAVRAVARYVSRILDEA